MTDRTVNDSPAFPVINGGVLCMGMTLRDYYIAHAPASEIADLIPKTVEGFARYIGIPPSEYVGERDYLKAIAKARGEWADAMLEEREKK